MKKLFLLTYFTLFTLLILTTAAVSQTPMHYNANSGGIGNSLPFGSLAATGYKCQWLIGPNEFSLPSLAPFPQFKTVNGVCPAISGTIPALEINL